ncbi:SAM-dependent methyltransferase [Wenzhouxiangella marina]|uniref:Tetrapyrrole methylase family protein n=1 Tax=Wenzhouxiangella marina TaxID=1579979 RepID=A0A0K0XYY4_9GAMM|nr:SAM-dependent methyltransferase [Wenzhouxiangella marina]AKS42899.1 Tetrapyrrole methylase family protein [Wenzhouxiangella marina]MBB6087418.1 hypothetical protein [Wenzhouxiangella marina]
MNRSPELVIVGSGIQLGRHMSPRSISEFESADAVFALADPFTFQWLQSRRPELVNLSELYADDRDRRETYEAMTERLLAPLGRGESVCAVFYGHPGVFACVPHRAIERARHLGHVARMEPGISAEDCLVADLGLDPGERGMLACEATQFLINQREADPSALLILWQVTLTGNLDCIGFEAHPPSLELLVGKLARWYPLETEVILYEAARLPIEPFRADRLPLADLPRAGFKEWTTLVIPPIKALELDEAMVRQLRRIRSL